MEEEFAPGKVVAGKFRIERVLGQGGMGVVVEATHLQLDQRVALKFLLPGALRKTESLARFAREARAAAAIRGEHVARVIDVGTLETGAPYIVMEYLEGLDLGHVMAKHGRLSLGDALTFVLQACEALAEAHGRGIVHRDLKPSNLFVTHYPDGTPCLKILDFGISKLTLGSSPDLNMTDTATVMGTPHYMSPEQMRSTRSVDARSDIWSLGVILYELLAGQVPFQAETMPQLCSLVLEATPPRLVPVNPGVPPALEAVVLRCLEKEPGSRFQSVFDLAAALGRFAPPEAAQSVQRIARLSGTPAQPSSISGDLALERGELAGSPARLRGKLALTLALSAFALLGLAAWAWRGASPGAGEGSAVRAAAPPPPGNAPRTEPTAPPLPPPAVVPDLTPSPPPDGAESTNAVPSISPVSPTAAVTEVKEPAKNARVPKQRRRPAKRSSAPAQPAQPAPAPNPLDGRL